MGIDWSSLLLFAQEANDAVGGAETLPQQNSPGPSWILLPILLTMAAYYLFIYLPDRQRNKKHDDLLGGLKKNDRVQTIGGWYGVVANAKAGEEDIVLKIDDDKDVKIRIDKRSIRRVIVPKDEEDKS